MRRMPTRLLFILVSCTAMLLQTAPAEANKLDLTPARFIECRNMGDDCRAHNVAYERFMSEYLFGVSPKLLAPASTLGYSGFYLGVEASVMTIPSSGTAQYTGATYENYEDARWRIGTGVHGAVPPAMFFPTVHVRKGLPWSVEIGSSISYLAQSELVALGGEVKWAPFEGYRKKFLGAMPDIAARGTVNRIIGQSDLDLTVLGVDGSISYPFGIGGMISLEPYAGYQHLWSFVRTEPMILRSNGGTGNFQPSNADSFDVTEAFLSGPDLTRHKIFFGMVFRYELLAITMDWAWGLPQDWTTQEGFDQNGGMLADGNYVQKDVHVDTQFAFSFGTALEF